MDKMIKYKDLILTAHEWAQGDCPTDKVLAARRKAVVKGQIHLITNERDFYSDMTRYEVRRKI